MILEYGHSKAVEIGSEEEDDIDTYSTTFSIDVEVITKYGIATQLES